MSTSSQLKPTCSSEYVNPEVEVQMFTFIISESLSQGASDIKLDATENGVIVDLKINGRMKRIWSIPVDLMASFMLFIQRKAHLKVGNITEKNDSGFFLPEFKCSFRASQLHKYNEFFIITIRVLDQKNIISLDRLNLPVDFKQALRNSLKASEGLIILSGPTDSGKTTTICSAIRELSESGLNILSVEDPIEYRINGVSQFQVKETLGFNQIMRQFLRMNPDVIFLGEVRDQESAKLCLEASRTGHLVITTIHAYSPEAIKQRFIEDFGINARDYDEFLVLASSQRLLRTDDGNGRYLSVNFSRGAKCLE